MFVEVLLIILINCVRPQYPSGGNCLNESHFFSAIEHPMSPEKNVVTIYMLLLKDLQDKLNEKASLRRLNSICWSVDSFLKMYTH